jgi:PAS domain S-box-containing protein
MKISFNIAKRLHVHDKHLYAAESYKQAILLAREIISRPDAFSNRDLGRDSKFLTVSEKSSEKAKRFYRQMSQKVLNLKISLQPGTNKSREYSESLLKYIESIDWQKKEVEKPPRNIFSDPHVRKVAESIGYIKSEINDLLEERDAAEKILREKEYRYRRLVEHARAGILEFDYKSHRIISVNDSFLNICGYSQSEISAMAPEDLMTPASRELFRKRLELRMAGKPVSDDAVYEFFTKTGEKKWVMLTANIALAGDLPRKADIIIIDITPVKNSEARLLEYQTRLKDLSTELSRAEERERRNLASQLHEGVGQELFVAQLKLAGLKKYVEDASGLHQLDAVNAQIVKSMRAIRSITFDLSPPVLYELGLAEALESLARTFESRHGLIIKTEFNGDLTNCRDEFKPILYRAVKEILHNTVKHARAKQVSISLEKTVDDLFMDITDNGVGFDTAPFGENHYTGSGFGLFDIRERIQNLGGEFRVCSTPGQGTRVSFAVPLAGK